MKLVETPAADMTALPVVAVIPHRQPFLMIDHVVEGTPGRSVIAEYRVDPDNPVFAGHFPGFAIFPGVLVLENMAQAACWVLASAGASDGEIYMLVRINQCTFQGMVKPGDTLITRAVLARQIGQFCQFECQVEVDGQRVATTELLVARRAPA